METWSYTWAVRNLIAELIMPPGIWVMWVLLMLFLIILGTIWYKLSY